MFEPGAGRRRMLRSAAPGAAFNLFCRPIRAREARFASRLTRAGAAGAALRLPTDVAEFFLANCGWGRTMELGRSERTQWERGQVGLTRA